MNSARAEGRGDCGGGGARRCATGDGGGRGPADDDDTITPDNTLNCSANPLPNPTVEQSYYRRFHLPDYGVTGPFTVTGVTFGIQRANDGAGAGQPMTVRLEKIPAGSPLLLANLTLSDFEDLTIADSENGHDQDRGLLTHDRPRVRYGSLHACEGGGQDRCDRLHAQGQARPPRPAFALADVRAKATDDAHNAKAVPKSVTL